MSLYNKATLKAKEGGGSHTYTHTPTHTRTRTHAHTHTHTHTHARAHTPTQCVAFLRLTSNMGNLSLIHSVYAVPKLRSKFSSYPKATASHHKRSIQHSCPSLG